MEHLLGQLLSQVEQLKSQVEQLNSQVAQLEHSNCATVQQPGAAVQWSCALGPEHSNCRCAYQFDDGSANPSSVDVTCQNA